ncbi:hypothetical protein [Bradyrhizobium jicamae]|uniref:hypothetical protein n=1 Tax=Bradyrhizobium jicamae TaxID=280332 RepID=UPI0020121850|nr:hypothetical protein [Bradyrhizobium jicamae]
MTYQEIADMLGCDVEAARTTTIKRALDRKKSRDGMTRAKLDLELTARFVSTIRDTDRTLDQAVHELRSLHQMMSRSDLTDLERAPPLDNPGFSAAG